MSNFEQYHPVKKHLDPEREEKSLKDVTFKFSEKEKEKKIEGGMSDKEIKREEEEVIERQKLSSEEKKENEGNIVELKSKQKKPSFERFKIQQEIEFYEKLKAARQRKDAAYKEQEKKAA